VKILGGLQRHRCRRLAAAMMLAGITAGCLISFGFADDPPLRYGYRIKNIYPHDPQAFTQGLVYEGGFLYESTGLYRRSSVRRVALETGRVVQRLSLPPRFFGEGLTVFDGRLIQLTWRSRTGFVYDKRSFQLQARFHYPTEGWGLTHDGQRLILSDGSSSLYFLDPTTFRETGRIRVFDHRGPVDRLNELEYIGGEIYANVWRTDRIARISPLTGEVVGWIDLSGLLEPNAEHDSVDVLNGIAYDFANERLFVTGKLWPKLFEIELIRPGAQMMD
jgi:glutamine cyclotransferase